MNRSEYQRVEEACRTLNSIPNGIGTGRLWKYLLRQAWHYFKITCQLNYTRMRYGSKSK